MMAAIRPCCLAGLMVVYGIADADSMRCGRKLIKAGDSAQMLRARCGAPVGKDSATVKRTSINGGKPTRVQRWHYRQGRRGIDDVVLVYSGRVVGIETGSRN